MTTNIHLWSVKVNKIWTIFECNKKPWHLFNLSEKLRVCCRKNPKKNLFCDTEEMVKSTFSLTTNKSNRDGYIWNWENCPFATLFLTWIFKISFFHRKGSFFIESLIPGSNRIVITKNSCFSRSIVWKICRKHWKSYLSDWVKVSQERKKFMDSLLLSILQLIKTFGSQLLNRF